MINLQIRYLVAGLFMGVAELIPGISGSTVAVIFKIYKNLMSILSELKFRNLTFDLQKLSRTFQLSLFIPLVISMVFSVIIFSNGIEYLIINYEKSFLLTLGWLMILSSLYVVHFFKPLLKDFFLLVFFLIGALSGIFFQEMVFVAGEITGLYLFLSGILAFSFFLIPGISGSAVLVILGVYPVVIQGIANFNLQTLIPFGIGCLISLIILPKFILNLFLIYEQRLMFIFSGLIFASGYLLI